VVNDGIDALRAAVPEGGEVGERLISTLPPEAPFDTHPGSVAV
jgi:hypothetical protein